MTVRPHGLTPVRLDHVRVDIRLEAAKTCNRIERDDELLAAALFPSDRVYWLSAAARDVLVRVAA